MNGNFLAYVWQHSRKEQLFVLLLVLLSLPFYWASLDVPKLIVNDAIQGRAFRDGSLAQIFSFTIHFPDYLGIPPLHLSDGWMLAQVPYLMALSCLFLALTLVNGAFKYVINVRKGILGERMLRRLRFELFSLVMRFRPEDIKATKSAEIASMIKDEVEPIGGFFGESFITPAFLGMQAATALLFILVQNIWLGLLAALIIGVQGFLIPKLRLEQLRLGRLRQIASRKLAGRISEMVDSAPMLHAHGIVDYSGAEIGDRLGQLFWIRMDLFRRKFSVKFINNLLAQVTPFVFYTLGGYYALKGQLDIGQLVAVIAAYRDLPTPIKELIDWDQQRADVTVKFEQVVGAFSRDVLPPAPQSEGPPPAANEAILISGLVVTDSRNVVQLERLSLVLERPAHIALVGPQGSARDVLPKVLGRQITQYSGLVSLGTTPIAALDDGAASRAMLYVGSDPYVLPGSILDNICLVTRRRPPPPYGEAPTDAAPASFQAEARRTGNPAVSASQDWIDYASFGLSGPEDLDRAVIAALRVVRGYDRVFLAGMEGRVGTDISEEIEARFITARGALRDKLAKAGMTNLVEPFDQRLYNSSATIGENLLFGIAVGARFSPANIASDPFVRAILEAEGLLEPLIRIGYDLARQLIDVFSALPEGSPLFERYSFFDPSEKANIEQLLEEYSRRRRRGTRRKVSDKLLGFALQYIEPRHRLNLIDRSLTDRLLRARFSFRNFLSARMSDQIEFYDRAAVIKSAPIRDNLLFGRIGFGIMGARNKVADVIAETIRENALEGFVLRQGLAREAGPGGRLLSPEQRAMIALARAVLVKPDTLILDNALSAFTPEDQQDILTGIREGFAGASLIVTLGNEAAAAGFDRVIRFSGARLVGDKRDNLTDNVETASAVRMAAAAG